WTNDHPHGRGNNPGHTRPAGRTDHDHWSASTQTQQHIVCMEEPSSHCALLFCLTLKGQDDCAFPYLLLSCVVPAFPLSARYCALSLTVAQVVPLTSPIREIDAVLSSIYKYKIHFIYYQII